MIVFQLISADHPACDAAERPELRAGGVGIAGGVSWGNQWIRGWFLAVFWATVPSFGHHGMNRKQAAILHLM